ncbi:MAG: hypothetical protein L6R38_007585 [Xanthoria sp. 2 TBL-2021]|nr:MAG: hypothetical protein L6R38_007585 [Xanthoria sp. 2 TBL-2021]
MHFSTATIIAAGALCTVVSAAPAPAPGAPFPSAVKKLDADGKVTWTQTDSGARTAQISFDDIDSVASETKIKQRGSPGSSVESWTNLGQIANYAAEYACQDSGAFALSSVIESSAKNACKELVGMIPGAPIASKAWNVWQGARAAANGEGKQVQTLYRFFYKSASAPKLDEAMCNKAMSILTESACQGKGGNGDSTRGGEIRIGDDDDYIQIGFDPNES